MSAQHLLENTLLHLQPHYKKVSDTLIEGHSQTLEHYKHQCGYLQGLRDAEQLMKTVYEKAFQSTSLNVTEEKDDHDSAS